MPTSLLAQVPYVVNLVETIPREERRTLLEVGPGCGTYGVLVRGYVNDPPDRIDAVEVWLPYVDRFRLGCLYDNLYVGDVSARRWRCTSTYGPDDDEPRCGTVVTSSEKTAALLLASYDVVLMGDVIEHLPKQTANDLLDRIPGRVVICTPVDDVPCSGEGYENPAEAHVSHWTRKDWKAQEERRPVEVVTQANAGWLVRLGRLP